MGLQLPKHIQHMCWWANYCTVCWSFQQGAQRSSKMRVSNERKWEPADAEIIFAIIYLIAVFMWYLLFMTVTLMFHSIHKSVLWRSLPSVSCTLPSFLLSQTDAEQKQLNRALHGALECHFQSLPPMTQSKHKQIHHLPISSLPYLASRLSSFIGSVE